MPKRFNNSSCACHFSQQSQSF
ncbi:MAG: hypothetical protein EAZ78_19085 [Oscillatoriales cyanobacterium]|nr:MAG: hypothetical protein EA000_08295 [Oscillatoriales cyanobacterium]TAD93416.1 MAG: hypothetical protein EAZ98_22965 [Oscillatoriales cyanobacterium]TAE02013.1 MAG: hypothetical protein EAZ96_17290 [Oscillatoriales cyanobacterium]TAF01131.1 MAG: hypothetical protein EAZ78_19085 [Oscillatoriales cyanobacterium]TAF38182.1 MAG: hypothetical protein EAZ68_13205 [Oscillatoriales cyanobacterium]